ncbi:MAG TPA: YceI family protein [Usitatibacteraceae bacterium]
MKKILSLLLLATASSAVYAVEYSAVQADKSAIQFQSKQMGVTVQGRFPKFTAQLDFDPAKPEAAKVNIAIDVASIDAGSKDANDEVVGKQWFNARAFPTATFASTAVKALGGGRYEVSGPLTIKGKALAVVAPLTFKADGSNGVFAGTFTIKRLDYAIGEGPWADISTVANEVQINFNVVASPAAKSK